MTFLLRLKRVALCLLIPPAQLIPFASPVRRLCPLFELFQDDNRLFDVDFAFTPGLCMRHSALFEAQPLIRRTFTQGRVVGYSVVDVRCPDRHDNPATGSDLKRAMAETEGLAGVRKKSYN